MSTHSHLPRNRPRSQRGRAERAYLPRVDGNYAGWAGQVRTQPRLPKPRHDRLGAHHDVDPLVLGRDDKPDWRTAQGGLVGAKRPQTAIRVPTRGDLWAPNDAKWRFVTPCEGVFGDQAARNGDSGRHARGFVGTTAREISIRDATRGGLWAPGARKRGFAARPRGFVGANPADRHAWRPRAGLCGCRTPHCAPARQGPGRSNRWSTDGPFCVSTPSRVTLPASRREPGRPPAAPARADRLWIPLTGPLAPPGCSGRA